MREIRKIRKAYRKHMLAQICTLAEEKFGPAFGMETVYTDGLAGEDYYHFRDNGSRVLAVAHLDTVVRRDRRKPHFYDTKKGPMVRSGALDDRLGAYVILGLLPRLGINCDWLLTVGEEWGQSTAIDFKPGGKEYDWVIEFDRAGTDVVMYQYEDAATRQAVRDAGADTGVGSFSDIAYLEHLGVKAFNWGVGYQGNYHSEAGFAYLNDTFAMVAKYMKFHKRNAGITMTHEPAPARTYGGGYSKWYDECWVCTAQDSVSEAGYCCECGGCQECGDDEAHCGCYGEPAQRHTVSRDWKADAEGETADDAVSAGRAAFLASERAAETADEAAAAREALFRAAGEAPAAPAPLWGAITDTQRRARNMQDAVAAFKGMS